MRCRLGDSVPLHLWRDLWIQALSFQPVQIVITAICVSIDRLLQNTCPLTFLFDRVGARHPGMTRDGSEPGSLHITRSRDQVDSRGSVIRPPRNRGSRNTHDTSLGPAGDTDGTTLQ